MPRGISLPLVLGLTLLLPASALAAPRRHLSLREAERAIDLGWQAELAGDYAGARAALLELVRTATTQEELAGRERISAWLSTVEARETAFSSYGRSARGYHEAFGTLREFGLRRASLLWERAARELPDVRSAANGVVPVRVHLEAVRGAALDRQTLLRDLGTLLAKGGLPMDTAAEGPGVYDLRLFVDAGDTVELERGVRVTASATATLRDVRASSSVGGEDGPAGRGRVVASVAKSRSEVRRKEVEARAIASRRALDDLAQAVIFHVRLLVLEGVAASSTAKG